MTTGKLMWGMTWRGSVWGLLIGTLLGIIYGFIVLGAINIFAIVSGSSSVPSISELIRGIQSAGPMVLLILVFGTIFGLPTGFIVGALNGLLVGVLTRLFFIPLGNAVTFRWIISLASILFTSVSALAGFLIIWLLVSGPYTIKEVVVFVFFDEIPALIAGIAAGFISRLITRWYERESTKDTAQNSTPN